MYDSGLEVALVMISREKPSILRPISPDIDYVGK